MSNTLLSSALRMLWRTINGYGLDANALYHEAGLDPVYMNDPQHRYPVDNARQAWALAAQRIPDPCFGIKTGEHWFPTDLHALGFAFLSSQNLYNGLYRIVRYNEIVDEVIAFSAQETDRHLILSYHNERDDLPDIPALEAVRWSIVMSMCRAARGGPVLPLSVDLMQALPACCDAYSAFFGCTPRFGRMESQLVFDLQDLRQPLPAPHADIARVNDNVIREYLDQLHQEQGLSRRVAQVIRDLLPNGNISDERVAAAVFMSARTLQRKLALEGTSFKGILQEVRLAMANEFLRDAKLSLIEVSYLLGFADQSSFTRAYKRWTGTPPSDKTKFRHLVDA